ncbi:uncharacterized protein LOC128956547 [Oppia nitens]|uniref:uncharacterized protein LOC128956547 n=1 Tax=Oppia nitens TaxID=1686743 RepID=UPI0023DA7CB8|nr:uncharacterized protein LOC128956547 [Oppia nitens]
MSKRSASDVNTSNKRRMGELFQLLSQHVDDIPDGMSWGQALDSLSTMPEGANVNEWLKSVKQDKNDGFDVQNNNKENGGNESIVSNNGVDPRLDDSNGTYMNNVSQNSDAEPDPRVNTQYGGEHSHDDNEAMISGAPDPRNEDEEDLMTNNEPQGQLVYSFNRQPQIQSYDKFKRKQYTQRIKFNHNLRDLNGFNDIEEEFSEAIADVCLPIFQKHSGEDFFTLIMSNEDLNKPIFIGNRKIENFDRHEPLSLISKIAQSNQTFYMSNFDITLYVTETLKGSGRKTKAPETTVQKSIRKRSVVSINNSDNSCGYRAIYVGIQWFAMGFNTSRLHNNQEWKRLIGQSYGDLPQRNGAQDLVAKINRQFNANLDYNQPLKANNFPVIQQYLNNIGPYKLMIIDASDDENIIYQSEDIITDNEIWLEYIILNKVGHYNFIKNINAYRNDTKVCNQCHTRHHVIDHKCTNCTLCGSNVKCDKVAIDQLIECDVCKKTFNGNICYDKHINNNICLERKQCQLCDVWYKVDKINKHQCNYLKCRNCGVKYNSWTQHNCMINPLNHDKLKKEDDKIKFIVCYDIESKCVCDNCWDVNSRQKSTNNCNTCGLGQQVFQNKSCVKSFFDYLISLSQTADSHNNAKVYVFAHNAKGYDSHFLLQELINSNYKKKQPELIMTGMKILKMVYYNIEFIDSLCLFQQPLASLPKSFGFESVVTKGYFPHLFNTEPTEEFIPTQYIGRIPDIKYFGIDHMSPSNADSCQKWHEEYIQSGQQWDFKHEIVKYCQNDVKILTMALMEFRKLFKDITGLDPITRKFTLAGVGLEYFRTQVLQENIIGVTPLEGYSNRRNKSISGNVWLDLKEYEINKKIAREVKLGNEFADGFCHETNTVYEYWGCYWHGCHVCFNGEIRNASRGVGRKSYDEVYDETIKKLSYYQRCGYNVVQIWGHQFKDLLESLPQNISDFVNNRQLVYKSLKKYKPINIREAFFDVTSLYPYVLSKRLFPIGHPSVLTDFINTSIDNYFGFIKCRVIPPKQLYIPILPVRYNGKLYFPLCKTCLESKSDDYCVHSDCERMLVGTWFSEELKCALNFGYKINLIIEVLNYEEKSSEIFSPYIKTFLKIKTEASGWPDNCVTEEQKNTFVSEFKEIEDVELDVNNMVKNSGLRTISKLMLNSLWGKLAQLSNQGQVKICSNYNDYYSLLTDAKYKITGEVHPNSEKLIVNYKLVDDILSKPGNTSVALAAMVTAYARLHLYSILHSIESEADGRVLYFDTDSVIFKHNASQNWSVPTVGNFLGQLTDEIEKDFGSEAYIKEFVSCGPKNYGYKVVLPNGNEINKLKVKGLAITEKAKHIVNYYTVVDIADKYSRGIYDSRQVPQQQFRCDKFHNINTAVFNKKYQAVSDKRIIVQSHDVYQTIPYGYCL